MQTSSSNAPPTIPPVLLDPYAILNARASPFPPAGDDGQKTAGEATIAGGKEEARA